MRPKYPICPDRIRRVPKQFSWVDHRLVQDGYLERLSHQASTLYLFLVTVGDARGISFYSDKTIKKHLSMDEGVLEQARRDLVGLGLLAYQRPLYQVLSLDCNQVPGEARRAMEQPLSLGQILKEVMGERS